MKKTAQAAAALSIALAAMGAQAQQQAIKPSAQIGTATSTVSLPPSVTFEQLSTPGRRMIVNLSAPRSEATVGRPADAHQVILTSDSWYCEREGTVATGAFATGVRNALEAYLAGDYRPTPAWRILANDPDLDAFAANLLTGTTGVGARIKARKTAAYVNGQGPAQVSLNDCYSAQEMLAIKNEVARILGPAN